MHRCATYLQMPLKANLPFPLRGQPSDYKEIYFEMYLQK
jgi:hypothetical protein